MLIKTFRLPYVYIRKRKQLNFRPHESGDHLRQTTTPAMSMCKLLGAAWLDVSVYQFILIGERLHKYAFSVNIYV